MVEINSNFLASFGLHLDISRRIWSLPCLNNHELRCRKCRVLRFESLDLASNIIPNCSVARVDVMLAIAPHVTQRSTKDVINWTGLLGTQRSIMCSVPNTGVLL